MKKFFLWCYLMLCFGLALSSFWDQNLGHGFFWSIIGSVFVPFVEG